MSVSGANFLKATYMMHNRCSAVYSPADSAVDTCECNRWDPDPCCPGSQSRSRFFESPPWHGLESLQRARAVHDRIRPLKAGCHGLEGSPPLSETAPLWPDRPARRTVEFYDFAIRALSAPGRSPEFFKCKAKTKPGQGILDQLGWPAANGNALFLCPVCAKAARKIPVAPRGWSGTIRNRTPQFGRPGSMLPCRRIVLCRAPRAHLMFLAPVP